MAVEIVEEFMVDGYRAECSDCGWVSDRLTTMVQAMRAGSEHTCQT